MDTGRVGQGQGRASLGRCRVGESRQSIGGRFRSLSLQPPAPPGLLKNVCLGKGASGRMGRVTYHIQGLPMGVGEGAKEGKKNII